MGTCINTMFVALSARRRSSSWIPKPARRAESSTGAPFAPGVERAPLLENAKLALFYGCLTSSVQESLGSSVAPNPNCGSACR